MMLMVAGGLTMQAVAGPGDGTSANNNPSAAYTKAPGKKVQTVYQVLQPKNLFQTKTPVNYQIDRIGGISSRPWAQIAGSPAPPAFYDQRGYDTHLNLFWIGATPN